MGENLTTADVDVTNAVIGERWRIGTVLLEVTAPRVPCFKLGIKMGDGRFPIRFAAAGRPGAYLRIIEHGELGAGDVVTVADVPGPRRHRRPRRPRLPRRPLARRQAAHRPGPRRRLAGVGPPPARRLSDQPASRATLSSVTTYRVRFEGPVELALRVATALADADGVDLTSSEAPTPKASGLVGLDVTVDGLPDDVIAAVGGVRGWLPDEATIEIVTS